MLPNNIPYPEKKNICNFEDMNNSSWRYVISNYLVAQIVFNPEMFRE